MTGPPPLRDRLASAIGHIYTIERQLHGGGMALVFVAEERTLHRRVVLKLLPPDLAQQLSAERFAREVRLSASLQHPHIVPVLAAGDVGGAPYYTMPFVEGESLRECLDGLAPGTRLPLARAASILRDVARALAYAHDQGVVHRDIKPANVLLSHDAAVVADFGIAKAMDIARTSSPPGPNSTLTGTGVVLGTPAYMAPEQAAGDPAVDFRADLYAWGVMAYELLTGAHPFGGRTSLQALLAAQLTETPRPIADVAPDVPAALATVVMQCLEKQAEKRPAHARLLASAVDLSNLSDPTITVPHASSRQRALIRRISVAALALIVIGGGVGYLRARVAPRTDASRTVTTQAGAPAGASAFDLYLLGKVRASSENGADNDTAIATLRQAIAADASFAPAYAALARAYLIKAFYFAPDAEKKALNVDAEVAIAKALSLDPKSAEARLAQGLMLWTPARRFPHEQAIQSYRQAIALDSTLDEAHHQLAVVYFHVGLLDRADAEINRALALNPANSLARMRRGVISMYRGDFQTAYDVLSSSPLERNPALWGFQMGNVLFRLGRTPEAFAMIDSLLARNPKDEGGVGSSVRAMLFAKAGRIADADTAIQRAIDAGRGFGHFHHTAYNIGAAYAIMGRRAEAIRWLTTAADDGFPCYPLFRNDALLNPLRDDPRFVALLARLKRDFDRRRATL